MNKIIRLKQKSLPFPRFRILVTRKFSADKAILVSVFPKARIVRHIFLSVGSDFGNYGVPAVQFLKANEQRVVGNCDHNAGFKSVIGGNGAVFFYKDHSRITFLFHLGKNGAGKMLPMHKITARGVRPHPTFSVIDLIKKVPISLKEAKSVRIVQTSVRRRKVVRRVQLLLFLHSAPLGRGLVDKFLFLLREKFFKDLFFGFVPVSVDHRSPSPKKQFLLRCHTMSIIVSPSALCQAKHRKFHLLLSKQFFIRQAVDILVKKYYNTYYNHSVHNAKREKEEGIS